MNVRLPANRRAFTGVITSSYPMTISLTSGSAIGTYNNLAEATPAGYDVCSFYVVVSGNDALWNVGRFRIVDSDTLELVALEDYPGRARDATGGSHEIIGPNVDVYEVLSAGLLQTIIPGPIRVISGTTYNLSLADQNRVLYFTSSSPVVVGFDEAMSNFRCTLVRGGTGTLTVDMSSTSATLSGGPTVSAQHKSAELISADYNSYYMFE